MNRAIKKSKITVYLIAIIAVLIIVGVWPFGVIHRTYKTASTSTEIGESKESLSDHMIAQVFASEGNKLDWIEIYICNDMSGQRLDFAIYDGEFNRIYHREFTAPDDIAYPGYVRIPTRFKVERGVPYIYTIYGLDRGVKVGLEEHIASTNTSLFTANYDGGEDAEHNICTRIKYSVGFNIWQTIVLDITILLLFVVLIFVVSRLFKSGKIADSEVKVQTVIQYIFNPIVVITAVFMIYMIFPGKTFTDNPVDIIFYVLGIVLLAVILLYYINFRRTDYEEDSFSVDSIYDLFTVVAIAMVIWHCFEYMNGLYDIVHSYSARWILVWFLIMIITTYRGKDIFNVFNGIWVVVGIPICYLYAKPYIGLPEEELLYKLNAWVIYTGGYVVITTIRMIVNTIKNKSGVNKLYLPYAIPYFVFMTLLLIKANTRWWPGYLVAISAILIIRLLFMEDVHKFVELLCDGILLNFIFMVVFSLMHRPYYGYIYHRYNMTYFTVTMTATHLAMVILAAAVRLYVRYRGEGDVRKLIPDMALFGMAGTYELLTLSRTGYATVIFAVFVALIFTVTIWSAKKSKIKDALVYVCAMLISVIVMFPVTFTLTRTIPPLVDDPVIYDYEPCIVTIYKGTEPDNENYMTVDRFIDVFKSKVLDIGDSAASTNRVVPVDPDIYRTHEYLQLADADDSDVPYIENEEEDDDASNGRMDIFRSYIEQSDFKGHDEMGAMLDDGSEASHAHNIYLQAIYDHGWIIGIMLGLFMIYTVMMGMYRSKKAGSDDYMLLVPILTVGFMTAGLVEWIFHPCNPYGLSVFMVLISMIFTDKAKEQ